MGKPQKVASGKYEYRGYKLRRHGYYQPEKRVVWEAYKEEALDDVMHGYSLHELVRVIDNYLDK
jgi:hypothetical protein